MMWLMMGFTAFAGVPSDIRPALAAMDAPEQYAEYARSVGRSDVLACESFWADAALLCWRRANGLWVTRADLRAWDTSHTALLARAQERATEAFAAGWTETRIEGIQGSYWVAPDPEGWAHAAVLAPERIAQAVGSDTFFVSAPVDGILLAWAPGHAELDRAVAIGAHKMYDTQAGPVTPVVFRYRGGWTAFAEATPRQP